VHFAVKLKGLLVKAVVPNAGTLRDKYARALGPWNREGSPDVRAQRTITRIVWEESGGGLLSHFRHSPQLASSPQKQVKLGTGFNVSRRCSVARIASGCMRDSGRGRRAT